MASRIHDKARSSLLSKIGGAIRNVFDEIAQSHGSAQEFCIGDSFALLTTDLQSDDLVKLYKFPPGAYLTDLRITASDMDTNATPALVFDIVTVNDADSIDVVVINDSTIGQGGGSDRIDDAAVGEFVGDKWLAFDGVTNAATGAAGTLKVFMKFAIGILNYDGGNKPRMTDAAI